MRCKMSIFVQRFFVQKYLYLIQDDGTIDTTLFQKEEDAEDTETAESNVEEETIVEDPQVFFQLSFGFDFI